MTTLCTGSPEGWQHLFKRTFDIVVSLAAILMLAPLFLLAALSHQAHLAGASVLHPGTGRPEQEKVSPVQVPHHGGRCGTSGSGRSST